mmetsp:Transcript_161114/g.512255  ORF Transcript_161114/g.512255 Transcript_161114/m.512255 type:complete len:97 (+) Transcript_161114:526-816(+)
MQLEAIISETTLQAFHKMSIAEEGGQRERRRSRLTLENSTLRPPEESAVRVVSRLGSPHSPVGSPHCGGYTSQCQKWQFWATLETMSSFVRLMRIM